MLSNLSYINMAQAGKSVLAALGRPGAASLFRSSMQPSPVLATNSGVLTNSLQHSFQQQSSPMSTSAAIAKPSSGEYVVTKVSTPI